MNDLNLELLISSGKDLNIVNGGFEVFFVGY